jgi:DNA-binding NarL/FixJ family response regulator
MLIEFRLGEMQMMINETGQGSAHLNNAFTIARNLGMRPYLSKISKTISQSGVELNERMKKNHSRFPEDFHLTKRQNEILKLLCSGSTNKEIAEKMFLSRRTVDMHVSHILERLNCRTRTEAISRARELEII